MTFSDFKREVNEIVRSKKGALPDLNDWKRIKQMMDEVEDTELNKSYTISNNPYQPYDHNNRAELFDAMDFAIPTVDTLWTTEPNGWKQLSFDFE